MQFSGPDEPTPAPTGGIPADVSDGPTDVTDRPGDGVPGFVPDPSLAGVPAGAVEPFAPPSDAWRRVSPRLRTVRRISSSIWVAILVVPAVLVTWFLLPELRWIPLVVAALGLAWWLWLWFRAPRVVAAYGWARRENDLCIVSGLWFKHLEVVPFGRMQVVKVSSGPLLRAHGLANVEMVTASATSNAVVPGLPADEARELRDLIIELSDAKGSGL